MQLDEQRLLRRAGGRQLAAQVTELAETELGGLDADAREAFIDSLLGFAISEASREQLEENLRAAGLSLAREVAPMSKLEAAAYGEQCVGFGRQAGSRRLDTLSFLDWLLAKKLEEVEELQRFLTNGDVARKLREETGGD